MPETLLTYPLPLVESGQKYAPGSLAREIQNMRLGPDGVLVSVRGPAPIIPDYGSGYPWGGRIYGVFHALLDDGQRDVTLVRAGTRLLVVAGYMNPPSVEVLVTGLSDEPNARYPDQFVEVSGKVVWNNGVDEPRIYDGYTVKSLAYDRAPGAPSARGPGDSGHPAFRNATGYSHPGRIGTVGDFFTQQSGTLLDGSWVYYAQFEDIFGNRSPVSVASSPVVVRRENTQTSYWDDYSANYPGPTLFDNNLGDLTVQVDDLTRQFCVEVPIGPEGTVARIVGRSADLSQNTADARFLVRIPDNVSMVWPDDTRDANLGAVLTDYVVLPAFQAMCAWNGCLVVLEGRTVRVSDPGFPGSFRRTRYVPIDADGAAPTGVFTFAKKLYAATSAGVFRVEDTPAGLEATRLVGGLGLVGPNATASTELGVLVGMSANGWWSLDGDDGVQPISREEYPLFKRLNVGRLTHVAAVWNERDKEAMFAIPIAGGYGNTLCMCWDGSGWRRRRYGLSFESLCATRDWRRYVLGGGRGGAVPNVWSLSSEVQSYTPPTKTYLFKSAWLRADPNGMKRFNVNHIFVGIVETSKADVTCEVWQNGSRDTRVGSAHTFELVNPATREVLDAFVVGTGKLREPRLTWKEVAVRVKSAESFAFDLSCDEPTYLSIAAFAFGGVTVDETGARASRQ